MSFTILATISTPTCRHTHTPLQLYPHHLAHTHAHSPAHPYTHSCHTYTRTPQQLYTHHLCTPLHLRTNIYKYQQPTIVTLPIYKYQQISTHAYIYKYPYCHTTVPINCTNAQIVVVNCQLLQKSSKSIVCQLQYTHFFLIPELKEYKLCKCWVHSATRTKDLKSKLGCVSN